MIPRNYKYYRLWGVVLLLTVLGLALILTLRALEENIIFFYAPHDLIAMTEKPEVTFRLGGLVTQNSYSLTPTETEPLHHFRLSDGSGEVALLYQGILPDLFREGQGIIGKGVWDQAQGLFIAEELLAKHDENYLPPEIAEALKKSGGWRKPE
ncbi:MAG: cytochrome c maturation protein CcmE [Alphaproteobacteria bacterium]|nr:cytochrome c maturation protein CcmE [Alphaproteobacteria bacterium]